MQVLSQELQKGPAPLMGDGPMRETEAASAALEGRRGCLLREGAELVYAAKC